MRLLPSRVWDAYAVGFILLFFALFFGWLLLPARLYPVGGDSYFYAYPLRVAAWRMIRAGQLPLWTPHVLSGYPLLSMAQLALAYPLTWGYAFLPAHIAETIYILAPFLLAPVFTYAFARQTGRSRAASLLAGLAFGWGGGIANALAHSGMMTNAVMWLPLLLVAIERARTRPFVNCLVGATAAYTLSVLSGHAQGFVYLGALALCYSLFLSLCGDARTSRVLDRVRPFAVCVGALVVSAGLSAFQLMETARAARRSVRSVIGYETFSEGSLKPAPLFESLALPLYTQADVSPYVAPVALVLALAGAWLCFRRETRRRDARPIFWTCAALVAFVLMLGDTTPLYRLVYHLPVINRFRVPARHAFELTFALAALAAYGFDHVSARLAARRELNALPLARASHLRLVAAVVAVAICAAVGVAWHGAALAVPPTPARWTVLTETQFAAWKIGFSALTLVALWFCLGVVGASRSRAALVASALGVAFFFEPLICYGLWWHDSRKDAARLSAPAAATRFMLAHAPEENRIYTRVRLFADETTNPARVDAPNLSAARGLRDVAGYEPLTLARYARALGDGNMSATRAEELSGQTLFSARSHVLDLLNASYVAVITEESDPLIKTLPRASHTPTTDARTTDARTVDAQATDARMSGAQATGAQTTVAAVSNRWEPVSDENGLLIVRNRRACPRAWLVAEAEPVDGEEALERIRGEGRDFDPRRTALVEDAPRDLPSLPGGDIAKEAQTRVVAYEPSRIVVETSAPTPTLLILSEMFYPGWEATVDGRAERIHLADFLLRAVPVPAGEHRVEMRYRAPQARNGALISLATLSSLAGLVVVVRRRRRHTARGRLSAKPSREG